MRQNPQRRAALLDAAIDVLANEGSRGLTLRAVDTAAGLPTGTTSNYFSNRGDLLGQVMGRVRERLTPDPEALAKTMQAPPSTELVVTLLQELMGRMRDDRNSHLAMLELRLESTRRPEMLAELSRTFEQELEDNVRFHLDSGLPGDRTSVVLIYLAMLGAIVDDLTVPNLLTPYLDSGLLRDLVTRTLPPADPDATP